MFSGTVLVISLKELDHKSGCTGMPLISPGLANPCHAGRPGNRSYFGGPCRNARIPGNDPYEPPHVKGIIDHY